MPVPNLLSAAVAESLTEAIAAELFASNLYKHVANQLQRLGFFGAAKFFRGESADELEHYQRHVDFFNDRGSVAPVPAVPAISEKIGSLRDAVQTAFDTELELGRDYEGWYAAADIATQQFLLQFIEIQRKSIGEFGDLIARLDRAGDDPSAWLIIDREMGGD